MPRWASGRQGDVRAACGMLTRVATCSFRGLRRLASSRHMRVRYHLCMGGMSCAPTRRASPTYWGGRDLAIWLGLTQRTGGSMAHTVEMVASNVTVQDTGKAWEELRARKDELLRQCGQRHPQSAPVLPDDFDERYTSLRRCLASLGFRTSGNAYRLHIVDYQPEDGHGLPLRDYAALFGAIARHVEPTEHWHKPCIIWKDEHRKTWMWTFSHGYLHGRLDSEELDPMWLIPRAR